VCEYVTFQVRLYSVHGCDSGEGKLYLRRDIPVLRGLRELKVNHHGKVPAYSSVSTVLYEEWAVFVLEYCFKAAVILKDFLVSRGEARKIRSWLVKTMCIRLVKQAPVFLHSLHAIDSGQGT
jgi:hypothetical protein